MLNTYLKRVQVLFLLCVVLLISTVTVGSFVLRESGLLSDEYWALKRLSLKSLLYDFTLANGPAVTIHNGPSARSVPVLLYHSIVSDGDGILESPDGENVSLKNFREQMTALKEQGWQTISIQEFDDFLSGKKSVPNKSFLLTFDDGAKASFYPVDPILNALDYRAVSFIITRFSVGSGSGYYLSSRELEFMDDSGRWDLQSHGKEDHTFYSIDAAGTQGHFLSNKLWLENEKRLESDEEYRVRILTDLATSRNDLETSLGNKVIGFAYPFGDYGHITSNTANAQEVVLRQAQSVYARSFFQVWGSEFTQTAAGADPFLVGRIEVDPGWSAEDVVRVMNNGLSKAPNYRDDFKADTGWVGGWGSAGVEDGLHLRAKADGTGAMAILDGSQLWSDYRAEAKATFVGDFSIVARYQDIHNYVSCDFSEKSVRLVEVVDGKTIVKFRASTASQKPQSYGISIVGSRASCYTDNDVYAASGAISGTRTTGGVGLKVYHPVFSTAEASITDLVVNEI